MHLARARAIVDYVVANAAGPVSVFVADSHGELVAAATMDGAAPDTRLNAQRKAYTAARSDARSTRELAEKARADPAERASFDPFFSSSSAASPSSRTACASARSGSAGCPARSTSSSRSRRSPIADYASRRAGVSPSEPHGRKPVASELAAMDHVLHAAPAFVETRAPGGLVGDG